VFNNSKPVLGINTDITSSEGHLLLPKKHSINFNRTFKKIMDGDFRWLMRARISVNFDGQSPQAEPVELHDQFLYNLEHRYYEHVEENRTAKIATAKKTSETDSSIKYPNLALNEIFIGESLSAR
jgi:NAD+ kinase